MPANACMQFGLAISFDAAQADDLAGMQIEAAVIHRDSAVVAMDDEVL